MSCAKRSPLMRTALATALAILCAMPSPGVHAEVLGTTMNPNDTATEASSEQFDVMAELPRTPSPASPPALDARLQTFLTALWPDAQKQRVSRTLFDRAFTGLSLDLEIFDQLANQPEHVTAPWDYMNRLVSDQRIAAGRENLAANAALLSELEKKYGVDKHVVLAIWGIESNFGTAPGNRHVIRSLVTLAIGDQRRPQFWRSQLLSALTIIERGDISLDLMTGSWAGAMGHTQFMPSSYAAHAVDFDGDGRRDIWGSVADALASSASYLRSSGWRQGEPWGFEVVLPAGFDFRHSRPGIAKTSAEWQALGLTAPFGIAMPESAFTSTLLLPAGASGPAFLVGSNFQAILKYNNSVSYAMAVGHLADRMAGGQPVAGLWPTQDPPLVRTGREELQRQLSSLGYDIGAIDGVIGTATRTAVRDFQAKRGLPEDGWATRSLLDRLKTERTARF